jgi:excisionase family DNA binding protein
MKMILMTPEEVQKIIESVWEKKMQEIKQLNEKEYLSYREAAEMLDIKQTTVSKHVRNGLLPQYIFGGKPYVKRQDIIKQFQ